MKENINKNSDNWKTNSRKRMLAVLLYYLWTHPELEKWDFFILWEKVYPENPLPRRKVTYSKKSSIRSNI